MSTAPLQAVSPQAAPNGVAFINGKITGKRSISTQGGRLWLTLVRMPSADEFSSGSSVELRSSQSLGDVGELVKVKVQIGGYPRAYNTTDKDTGEVRNVRTADIRLSVVE
jgi:hypothetical protein